MQLFISYDKIFNLFGKISSQISLVEVKKIPFTIHKLKPALPTPLMRFLELSLEFLNILHLIKMQQQKNTLIELFIS